MRGFTLIELLIAVVIIALLSAVALPLYQHSIIKAHRTEAKTTLLLAAAHLEQYYTKHQRYTDDQGATPSLADLGIPSETSDKSYQFSLGATAETYVLSATPTGSQAHADTDCATLTLNQLGEKQATGPLGSKCWL